jgi:hypothetical protein
VVALLPTDPAAARMGAVSEVIGRPGQSEREVQRGQEAGSSGMALDRTTFE